MKDELINIEIEKLENEIKQNCKLSEEQLSKINEILKEVPDILPNPQMPKKIHKILKTKKYKKYLEDKKNYEDNQTRFTKCQDQLNEIYTTNQEINNDTEMKEHKIKNFQEKQYSINALLKLYNDSFEELQKALLEHNYDIIITEDEKNDIIKKYDQINKESYYYNYPQIYEDINNVYLVHKTNNIPKNNLIETRMSLDIHSQNKVTLFNKEYEIDMFPSRNTIHFTANHEVSSHSNGNWDDTKYAIIIPLNNIPKDKIRSTCCVDTFVKGNVLLNNQSYILCPKDEISKVKELNPNINVYGYEGKNVNNYAIALLYMLNKPVEYGNEWGYKDESASKKYYEMLNNNGFENHLPHSKTQDYTLEKDITLVSYLIGVIKLITQSEELYNKEMDTLINELNKNYYIDYHNTCDYILSNEYLQEIFSIKLEELGIIIDINNLDQEMLINKAVANEIINQAIKIGQTKRHI